MMRYLLVCFVVLLTGSMASAQSFTYPAIKKQGKTLWEFVPAGWTIRDSVGGFLDADQVGDYAVVLQHKDSVTILRVEEGVTDTLHTQPRMLLILLGNKEGKGWQLAGQSNSFILNHDDPAMSDPYVGMSITKGILKIDFQLFYSMGSWYITNASYKWRWNEGQLVLIGADNYSFHRASHDFTEHSFNLLTRKYSVTAGNDDADPPVKRKVTWHTLRPGPLQTLKTFTKPFTWEVAKNFVL